MKRAAVVGERKAELVAAPDPEPKGDWVLVKIQAAPMCTEYKAWAAGYKVGQLGHEAVGEVAAVAQPGRVEVGDRVVVMPQFACGKCALCLAGDYIYCEDSYDFAQVHGTADGSATMAQYLLKPDWLLHPIPDGMSYERASLALCGLGPSFGAFQQMQVGAFDTVLITGAGPVGLGAVVNAMYRGATPIVVESIPYRVAVAGRMGVAHVLDPNDNDLVGKIRELTGGKGVDCALDCAGAVPAQRVCLEATRRRGRIAFIGECGDELPIRVSPDLIRNGHTLHGSWHYSRPDAAPILNIIQESPLIDHLISHVLPMSGIQDAFELSASQQTAKIILKPWE
jgi:threonine dehydrogenase-like Zn-dependent dehydrogenase